MNAYTLIEKLRKARRQHTISAGAQGLFLELMAINNEEQWRPVFRCPNGELCGALVISEKTLDGYRKELIAAGILGYECGKSRRLPSNYSLDGSRFGSSNGVLNGSKIEHHLVEKTPNLYKTKTESKTKKELEVVVVSEREQEINSAIEDYTLDNAVSDYRNGQKEEKEKNCAKKEIPTVDETIQKIIEQSPGLWRNVFEHILKPPKTKLTPQLSDQLENERLVLFKEFYEMKEDNYRIRFPTIQDIASNFYYWTKIKKSKEINTLQNATTKFKPGTSASASRSAANDERSAIAEKSAEFLSKLTG